MPAFTMHIQALLLALALAGCGQEPPPRTVGDGATNPAAASEPEKVESGSKAGVISDSLCGANHAGMIKTGSMGEDDISCTLKCVDAGSRFVLIEAETGKIYRLSDQEKPREFAGKKVTVSGEISESAKFIQVKDLSPAS